MTFAPKKSLYIEGLLSLNKKRGISMRKTTNKNQVCKGDCLNCTHADCINHKIYLPNEREFSDRIDEMILQDRKSTSSEWYLQGAIKVHEVSSLVANM